MVFREERHGADWDGYDLEYWERMELESISNPQEVILPPLEIAVEQEVQSNAK